VYIETQNHTAKWKIVNPDTWLQNPRQKYQLEDLRVYRRIKGKWSIKDKKVGWINLAQDKDQYQDFVNSVMNIRDP
jgi:hypothetical protein